jgi:hypothetical protein
MRRRAIVGLMAVLAASALVVGMSVSVAGAAGKPKPPPLCAGKTKAAAIKAIKLAYNHFLDGTKYPDPVTDKEPYIDHLSGKNKNAELVSQFEASAAQNAAAAATTSVRVDKVKCAGKKAADVTFTLVISGSPLEGLAPPGTAVLIGKTWKVGADTLCNTQALGDPSVLEAGPCYDIITAP